ncbi:hypothetical protein ACFV2X_07515 [Streptomyces sp. NPDC059679]|uniref:hypothetical protein n=1 Tax=Streptomyces sp. NPDC059679 TaxID=3346903 RepID=UPI0036A9E42F
MMMQPGEDLPERTGGESSLEEKDRIRGRSVDESGTGRADGSGGNPMTELPGGWQPAGEGGEHGTIGP